MVRSGLGCLKMVFRTILKMIIDFRIHQSTGNYEQVMGSHVLQREVNFGAKNLLVKNYFAEVCS